MSGVFYHSVKHGLGFFISFSRLWLAKCCKIQQLAHSYATTYIYVQQDIFIFNILYLNLTKRIFFQLQPKLFSFNKNVCSTSTKDNFIQQLYPKIITFNDNIYLFNFNPNYFHSTKIIIQLQPKIISFNNKVPGHLKYRHSTKFPVWSPVKYIVVECNYLW